MQYYLIVFGFMVLGCDTEPVLGDVCGNYGSYCGSSMYCHMPMHCDPSEDGTHGGFMSGPSVDGTCESRLDEDDSCCRDYQCKDGLICWGDAHCKPPSVASDVCKKHSDCEPDLICHHFYAVGENVYECQPASATGSPCTHAQDCTEELLCNDAYSPSECQEPGGIDAPCTNPEHCDSGHELTCVDKDEAGVGICGYE